MKNIKYAVAVGLLLFPMLLASAQTQLSEVRHPGDSLHYSVTFADGDFAKITAVEVILSTTATAVNQPGIPSYFRGACQKSSDPRSWNCDAPIPTSVVSGDYRLSQISVTAAAFRTVYNQDFGVPTVRIENPNTFIAPSKVTVKPRP